jgi:hypothetical protein
MCLAPRNKSGLSPTLPTRPHAAIREAHASLPQGSSAPGKLCCLAHPGLYNPMRQSHGHAAISWHGPYTQRLRCAGAPRRPAGPSLLLLPLFPYVPSTLPRASANSTVPLYSQRFQASSILERVATHQLPSLPAIPDGVFNFGAASFTSCYGPYVCLALLTGYDWMKSRALHPAL